MKKVIVSTRTREKRFAYLIDQTVEKIHIEQPQSKSIVGNVYIGQVTKVIPGMNAVFVEIGEGKGAYLQKEKLASFVTDHASIENKRMKSVSSYIKQGERIMVQVVKDATATKGPKLTGIIELAGKHLVYMPYGRYMAVSKKLEAQTQNDIRQIGQQLKKEEEGIIFRTSAATCSKEELAIDLEIVRTEFAELQKKLLQKKIMLIKENDEFLKELHKVLDHLEAGQIVVDQSSVQKEVQLKYPQLAISLHQGSEDIFSAYQMEGEVEKALKRIVWLKNGAYLIFDQAEGAMIIDVNTGKFEGKNRLEQTVLQTNELAAMEVARQIRLRDISGMILIDFIDMNQEEQKIIKELMRKELQKEERQTKVLNFTSLGILEITRKKTVNSLSETIYCKCPTCEGTGLVKSSDSIAFKLERELWEYRNQDIEQIEISATPDVIAIFCGREQIHQQRLQEVLGYSILFNEVHAPKPFYKIRYVGTY